MTWPSFDVTHADARTAHGFALIGRTVRHRRQRLGLTQRQLELLSGIDQSVISRLENGRLGGLRWSRFARLVEAMGGLGGAPAHDDHAASAVTTIVERRDGA